MMPRASFNSVSKERNPVIEKVDNFRKKQLDELIAYATAKHIGDNVLPSSYNGIQSDEKECHLVSRSSTGRQEAGDAATGRADVDWRTGYKDKKSVLCTYFTENNESSSSISLDSLKSGHSDSLTAEDVSSKELGQFDQVADFPDISQLGTIADLEISEEKSERREDKRCTLSDSSYSGNSLHKNDACDSASCMNDIDTTLSRSSETESEVDGSFSDIFLLQNELQKLFTLNKEKTEENVMLQRSIELLNEQNRYLRRDLLAARRDAERMNFKLAYAEDENICIFVSVQATYYENKKQRLPGFKVCSGQLSCQIVKTQDVLKTLQEDHDRVFEDRSELRSLFLQTKMKSSEVFQRYNEELFKHIEDKRALVRQLSRGKLGKTSSKLKELLSTTEELLSVEGQKSQMEDQLEYLRTKCESQDLYIADLEFGLKELAHMCHQSRILKRSDVEDLGLVSPAPSSFMDDGNKETVYPASVDGASLDVDLMTELEDGDQNGEGQFSSTEFFTPLSSRSLEKSLVSENED